MLTQFLPSLGTLSLAQAATPGFGVAIVIAAAGIVVAAICLSHTRSLQRRLTAARKECDLALHAVKVSQTKERELIKKTDERQEEIRTLKQETAVLRKKNHAAQEETKLLREQLRSSAEERDRLLAQKAAFSAPSKPKHVPEPKPLNVETAPPPPAVEKAIEPVPAAVDGQAELTARVAELEAAQRNLASALDNERNAVKEHKADLARVKKYAEQLRRIDMISKGKVEILEDRVATLGRQYYETVSELAVLKGEVAPPPSTRGEQRRGKDHPSHRADPRRSDADAGEAHATPESDSLAAEMEAAEAAAGAESSPG